MKSKTRLGAVTRKGLLALGLAAVAVLAFAAYRFFSNRAGEAAIRYIPADALLVATFDGTPSPGQVVAFAKIESALKREGISDLSTDFFDKTVSGSAFAKDIKPYISKNFAGALWANSPGGRSASDLKAADLSNLKPEGAIFIAVTDPGQVQSALQKDCEPGPGGLYRLKNCPMLAGVLDNYLLLCSSQARYEQIVSVSKGQAPSVAASGAYQAARAALPSDANFMLFVSPEIYKTLHTATASNAWVSMGAAVRDNGLLLSGRCPAGSDTLGTAPPINMATFKELPAGAYGVLCDSDPAKLYDSFQKEGKDSQKLVGQADDEMRKQVGLGLKDDILPGLQGDMELAVYPWKSGTSIQMVLWANSDNGADPVALAEKLKASIQAHSKAWKAAIAERQEGPATILTISDANGKPANTTDASPFDSVDIVMMNKSVFVTSSKEMTAKVVALSQGQGQSLADDTAFMSMSKMLEPNPQSLLMVSMYRILSETLKNHPEDAKWLTVFGGANTGIVGSSSYNASTGVGELFIPLDWDKAMRFIGESSGKSRGSGTLAMD